jgi:hypothetical protein
MPEQLEEFKERFFNMIKEMAESNDATMINMKGEEMNEHSDSDIDENSINKSIVNKFI